jgi:hypothetical protein
MKKYRCLIRNPECQQLLGFTKHLLSMFFLLTATNVVADATVGSPFDIQQAKQIIGGGTTPEYRVSPGVNGLASLGTRRLRLINVDNNLKAVTPDGDLKIEWSQHLKDGLELCKQNGWVPRLVVGHDLPAPLGIIGPEGRKYGPSSWPIYEKYINALLAYVTDEWGFKESEWEVGNEMNVPAANWVAAKLPSGLTDMEGFSAYMTLYTHIAQTVDKFRLTHPQTVTRIGGPAVPGQGYFEINESQNWTLRFVDEIAARRLPCDFVSAHVYGNDYSGAQVALALDKLEKRIALRKLAMPISVSEWGPNWHSDAAAVNLGPISGSFVLEFIRIMAHAKVTDAIFLALSKFPDNNWPVLYLQDGTPTHAMKVMQLVTSLDGSVLNCDTGLASVGCLAVKTPSNEVKVLVWNLDWWNHPIGAAKQPQFNAKVAVKISGLESVRYAGSITRLSTHSSNGNCPCPLGEVVAVGSSGVQLAGVNLDYGDYAFLSVSVAK